MLLLLLLRLPLSSKSKEPPRTNVITASLLWNLFSKAYWTTQYFPAAQSELVQPTAISHQLMLPPWIVFNTRHVLFGIHVCLLFSAELCPELHQGRSARNNVLNLSNCLLRQHFETIVSLPTNAVYTPIDYLISISLLLYSG